MKQTICALLLFFSAVLVFSQTKTDTLVYIMDVVDGPREERRVIQQNLETELRALGFSVTANVRNADYRLNCSIKGSALPLMVLTLLDSEEAELDSKDLVFTRPEEAYARFPEVLLSLFDGQTLPQSPAPAVSAAPETAAAQSPVNGVTEAPGTATEDIRPEELPALDAWKYKWLFLNARLGVSNRYFLNNGGNLKAVLFTGEAGVETEFHLFNFFALQFGVNYALEWVPRTSTPLTHILSVPFMAKFIFNTSPATALGLYGGGYASFAILGPITPPPLGLLAGVDLAVKAGPGAVLFDIRYSADLGKTDPHDAGIDPYRRMFLTLSAGYKVGVLPRKACR